MKSHSLAIALISGGILITGPAHALQLRVAPPVEARPGISQAASFHFRGTSAGFSVQVDNRPVFHRTWGLNGSDQFSVTVTLPAKPAGERTSITFKSASGSQTISLRHGNAINSGGGSTGSGSASSGVSASLTPLPSRVHNRIVNVAKPGSSVTVLGSGFGEGIRAFVGGVEMPVRRVSASEIVLTTTSQLMAARNGDLVLRNLNGRESLRPSALALMQAPAGRTVTAFNGRKVEVINNQVFSNRAGQPLAYDVFVPENVDRTTPGLAPAVLAIHGGGWFMGSRTDSDIQQLAVELASQGYLVFAPDYRLAPKFRHPAAEYDVSDALRAIKANASLWGVDATRVGVTGISAGGQLAMMSSLRGTSVGNAKCVLNIVGPGAVKVANLPSISVAPGFPSTRQMVATYLGLGEHLLTDARLSDMSPAHHLRRGVKTWFHSIYASQDPLIPASAVIEFHQSATRLGIRNTVEMVSTREHDLQNWLIARKYAPATQFMARCL